MTKEFYDKHRNFSSRTLIEYYISPGTKCKFDLLKTNLNPKKIYNYAIDLGSSGNSFLFLLDNLNHKFSLDIADFPLKQYQDKKNWYPLCGDLVNLPYRDDTFDFLSALDVIEHIREDTLAISEMSRVLKKNGILIISVPHRMKYYTNQDRIIGHFRRYELSQLISNFKTYGLRNLKAFGLYGTLMRIADIQTSNPKQIEENLLSLRTKYQYSVGFRGLWNIIVKILSTLMKIDAKYNSIKKIRNIGLIFIKK
jgi:SAM-dependent methyltransferase